jgi:predicted enzyme related to lactoylglutathione lyase
MSTNTDTGLSPGTCILAGMTTAFTPNTLAWFEVATDDPDSATSFYSDLFGWTFSPFADPETTGMDYRVAALPGSDVPFGGVVATGGAMPAHAVFYIAVTDVAATCEAVEQLGGKIESRELEPPAGPAFAYLRDPVGSLFGVFTPPA